MDQHPNESNRAIVIALVAAVLAGGAILYFWQRTPYDMEHRTLAGSTTTAMLHDAPRIDFETKEIDFGETLPIPEVKGKFLIRNTGKGTLELQPPRPSCGCTVSSLSADKLAPGQEAELPFTVSLTGIWGGDYIKNIGLQSNDPANGMVNLLIKGKIKPFVKIEPTEFPVGTINFHNTTNLTAVIRRLDGQLLNITNNVATNMMPSATQVNVQIKPVDGGNGAEQRLQISLSSGGKMGWFTSIIKLYSDDASIAQPIYDIPISGRWTEEVYTEPENLQWVYQKNAAMDPVPAARVRKFHVRSLSPGRLVKVTKMSASTDLFEFGSEIEQNGSVQAVTVTLKNYPDQTTTGTIVLETDSPAMPKFEVPFTITVFDEK